LCNLVTVSFHSTLFKPWTVLVHILCISELDRFDEFKKKIQLWIM
jgi:hypothetical protein